METSLHILGNYKNLPGKPGRAPINNHVSEITETPPASATFIVDPYSESAIDIPADVLEITPEEDLRLQFSVLPFDAETGAIETTIKISGTFQ